MSQHKAHELLLGDAVADMHRIQAGVACPLMGDKLADALVRHMIARLANEAAPDILYIMLSCIGGPRTMFEAMACMEEGNWRLQ